MSNQTQSNPIKNNLEKGAQHVQALGRQVTDGFDNATSQVGEGLSATSTGLVNSASAVAARLDDAGSYLRDVDASRVGQDLTRLIRNNPKTAIAAGLGLGFLVGKLLAPRRSR